jgi:hypothetical protein
MMGKSSIIFRIIVFSLLLFAALSILLSLSSCRRSRPSSNDRISTRNNDRKDLSPRNNSNNTEERHIKNLKSIYENTIKYWQYDEAAYFYNYTPQERIQSGRGICWDYALFFYNECQGKGIRNIHFVVSNNLKHAWNEL